MYICWNFYTKYFSWNVIFSFIIYKIWILWLGHIFCTKIWWSYVIYHFWVLANDWQVNSSPPGRNGHLLADNIFRCIFVNEKFYILINISLKFVRKGPIDNNSIGLENGLAQNRRQAIIWTNACLIHCIYAALGGDELMGMMSLNIIILHNLDIWYAYMWYKFCCFHWCLIWLLCIPVIEKACIAYVFSQNNFTQNIFKGLFSSKLSLSYFIPSLFCTVAIMSQLQIKSFF